MAPYNFFTPIVVKRLVQLTLFMTLGSIIADGAFTNPIRDALLLNNSFFDLPALWQPITSAFILPCSSLSFGSLLDLAFMIILLWLFSSQLHDFLGNKRFLFLYFSTIAVTAITSLIAIKWFALPGSLTLAPAIILALATVWSMCAPPQSFFFFFFFPFSAKWFLAIALLGTIGSSFAASNWLNVMAYSTGFLWSYFVAVTLWYFRGPFSSLWRFEAKLKRLFHTISLFFQWRVMPLIRKILRRKTPTELA
jgi:hypothetical protein